MQQASKDLDELVGVRTRAINRKLRDVSEYTAIETENIAKIAVGYVHTVALKADGTVVATDIIEEQLSKDTIDEEHKVFLCKNLKKINHMMAFDETLEKLYVQKPEQVQNYIIKLSSVFIFLTFEYSEKNKIQAAYFPYIIKKYNVFKGAYIGIVIDSLMELVKESNLYCRENALQALYSIGDAKSVIKALKTLDRIGGFHHSKIMMIDSLYCTVGSTNLNSRSLRFDYEVNAFVFDKETTYELIQMFQEDKEDSTLLTAEMYKKRSAWKKFVGWFAHLFTPFL